MSSFLMTVSGVVTTICVIKLINAGLKLEIFSYSDIVEETLGRKARIFTDIMIAASQFSFTISHVTFEVESLKSTIDTVFGLDTSKAMYAVIVLCILIPLAWVRDLGRFSFSFMIGNSVILFTVIVVSGYCISILNH